MLDFSRLQTPAEHGDVLIEPPGDRIMALVESNHRRLRSYSFGVIDTDVVQIREWLRRELCQGCRGPTVLTGHQPEFIHAGVWAKHVVAAKLATALGGQAINFVVDSDAPKDTVLRVRRKIDSRVRAGPVRYARLALGAAYEGIPALDGDGRRGFQSRVQALMGERYERSCMPRYFAAMEDAKDALDWVDQMVFARRMVERDFGVEMIEHRVSRVWFGPLLADMMLNGRRFAACYNAALGQYRSSYKVRSANRPIPDLVLRGERCELPVWVYRPGERRRRLFVERWGDTVSLFAGEDRFADLSAGDLRRWDRTKAALANRAGYLFRPRALSLTLWARVFVGDLFIHGIGGAKYDRITDGIIRRYYGVEPPAMACVSATMLMDAPRSEVDLGSLLRARTRLRDMRCNPQRHVGRTLESGGPIDERAGAVAESIDLKKHRSQDRRRRRAVFERIRHLNSRLVELDPSMISEQETEVRDISRMLEDNLAARRRDYFFAMLDRVSLQRLGDRLASETGFGV